MGVTQFTSSQFAVRAYHPSRIDQNSIMRRSQINCLGASRSKKMFSLPLTLMSSRNMKNHRALRASVFDFLEGISEKESYYILLGVSQYSTQSQLKRAYHRVAMRYHPDQNKDDPDAAAKFREIKHAYEVLLAERKALDDIRDNVFDFLDGISSKESYYTLLGVSQYPTPSELKRAYHRLAMRYHPDVNKDDPDAAAKFIEIKHAYEVLIADMDEVITPIKRTCYDWYSLKTLMAKCTTCGGQGHVYISVKTPPLGVKQQAMTCSSCNGTGHIFDLPTSDIS